MSENTSTPLPETLRAAPPASVTPASGFYDYLRLNVPNHLKLIAIIGLIIGCVLGFNYVRDLKAQLANQQKETSTLAQKFQTLGPAAVSGNAVGTASQVTQQASDAFGPAVMAYMQAQNSKLNSLTIATGTTAAQVTALIQQQQATAFTPVQQSTAGGKLTGYTMDESRKGGPALASVNLFYDPAEKNPTNAFNGTTWTHNQEEFHTALGEWVKQKDGGMATTVRLSRTVSKPDPLNPTRLIQVGTEDIPLTGSSTIYTPSGMATGSPLVIPRWTLALGLQKRNTTNLLTGSALSTVGSNLGVFGSLDYRVTSRYGAFVGATNDGLIGGISVRLDGK